MVQDICYLSKAFTRKVIVGYKVFGGKQLQDLLLSDSHR